MSFIKNSLNQSHEYIEKAVAEGDTVLDLTMGNGNDTVFLARLAGPHGKVFSFDIQEQALVKTRERLKKEGLCDRVTLIIDGHQNLDRYVSSEISAAMFNLGYLPSGDHSIGTKGSTTITALKKALKLLKVHGLVSIVVYYGGDSGFTEKEEVLDYVKTIDPRQFTVTKTEFVNQVNCPPILVMIEKNFI